MKKRWKGENVLNVQFLLTAALFSSSFSWRHVKEVVTMMLNLASVGRVLSIGTKLALKDGEAYTGKTMNSCTS